MSCGDAASDAIRHEPGQPYALHLCADSNRVQRTAEEVLVDPSNPLGWQPRLRVPTEPMEIQLDRGCVEPGAQRQRGGGCTKDDGKGDGRRPRTTSISSRPIWPVARSGLRPGHEPAGSAAPELRDVTNPPLIAADRSGRAGRSP